MQAMGLVNDHIEGCSARARNLGARAAFTPPRAAGARLCGGEAR